MLRNLLFLTLVVFGIGAITVSAQTNNEDKTFSKGIVNGQATSLPKPAYPSAAKAVGASGAVNVQVLIDENGNVASAKAVSGHPLLREASEQAANSAKFKPTMLDGKAVKVSGIIVYNFVAPSLKEVTGSEQTNPDSPTASDSEFLNVENKTILNGSAANLPKPVYPAAARAVKAEGTVAVEVTIDEEGNVIEARAVSGHPFLRMSSVEAAKQAKFKPTLQEGNPVKVNGIIVYNFVP